MPQISTTLLLGGRVYSPTHPHATALAIRDGVVAWLGSDDIGRDHFPDADLVELDGAWVTPGFVDSHVHLTATGLMLTGLDLTSATSLPHCLRMIADYATAHPGQPVWGHGWDESSWPQRQAPSTDDLDSVLGSRPAYLSRIDAHSALASTALRQLASGLSTAAGFTAQQPLVGEAHHLVRAVARQLLTADQVRQAQDAALAAAAAAGIVAVHECAGPDLGGLDDWRRLQAIEHGVEVIGYWGQAVSSAAAARALLEDTGARGLAGDLYVDGALGSRTAWLHQPYADAPGCYGTSYLDSDAVAAHLRACTDAGVTAGFHVIGDAALSAVVTALERVVDDVGAVAVARCGHRLEHLEMVTAEQAAKLAAWGIIASVQPNFDACWGGAEGMYAQRLGGDRASRLNNFALLAAQGVPLAFGSDAPVTGLDPWNSVRAAINHHTSANAVSVRAAFAAATRGGWRAAAVCDGVTGTLVPGAPASYAVWEAGDLPAFGATAHESHSAVQRWSTSPRAQVPALPRLGHHDAVPQCRQTVHRGAVIYG
ncbi:MAG: amidohydrolase [Mycobacteriaceae bacterium]|nr:amidohydrolase [Mycobacteriaceae bacterium]